MSTHNFSYLILDKDAKNKLKGKKRNLQQMVLGKLDVHK